MPKVKCCVCGKELDYTKEQAVKSKIHKRRYSHLACEPDGDLVPLPQPKEKEKTDEQLIIEYCESIYGKNKVNYAQIKRQIKQYKKEYNYTESGILKCLKYWFEVKKEDPAKGNGSLGIVPFIWNESYQYYYNLYLANQANSAIDVDAASNKEKEVTIQLKFKELKKKLFNFWGDEDEE